MRIKGFILDIDGTLLDSTKAHLAAWRYALREYGVFKTDLEINSQFGKKTARISRILVGQQADNATVQEIASRKTEILLQELTKIKSYPQVSETLQRIYAQQGKIIFVSNNYNRIIEAILQYQQWEEISVGFFGVDDVKNAKPDPEMIYRALEKLDITPSECVTIGDSMYDIQAGKAAGTKTIALCTKHTADVFEPLQPELILDEFRDIFTYLPLDI
ncbi:MAG: HAD family hydrolase [Promethearchaeota archaeon]